MLKKTSILICLFLTFAITANAQQANHFSGKITYQNQYFTPSGQDITPNISKLMGGQQLYYISGGNYKSDMGGSLMSGQLYHSTTNLLYTISPDKTALPTDVEVKSDSIIDIQLLEGDTLIAGRHCSEIRMTCTSGTYWYYYDPTLTVAVDPYVKHNFGNWNAYLQASKGALPILTIAKTPYLTIQTLATDVEPYAIPNQFFKLPDDVVVKKK